MSAGAGLLMLQRAGRALPPRNPPARGGRADTAVAQPWFGFGSCPGTPPPVPALLGQEGRGASRAVPAPKHPEKQLETQLGFLAKSRTLPEN